MVKVPIKKHPEFIVTTYVEAGFVNKTEITRCSSFKVAVDTYRKMCAIHGEYSSQILMEVVGYGEKI